MAERRTALWKRILGYSAFSLFALVAAFLITFPYDALKDRARLEADANGYFLKIGSIGPGLFAVRASNVEISKKKLDTDPDEKVMEPLKLDSISVGPALFPPGVSVTVRAFGGKTSINAGGLSTVKINVDADELDLSKGNLKGFTGIDMAGKLDAKVDLSIPKAAVGNGPSEPDLGQATGRIQITGQGLTVNGGTINVALPMYGPEPTPLDLPKVVLGELQGGLTIDKGAGKIDVLTLKSSDIELNGTGTLKLAKRIEYSEPQIEIRFKPDPEFQKRLGLIGSALSMVGPDPKDPSWRMGRLTGFLGRPNFR